MPTTRQQRLGLVNEEEEEELFQMSEGNLAGNNTAEPTVPAPAEPGAVRGQIATLEREIVRLASQLRQLSTGSMRENSRAAPEEEVYRSLQTPSALRDLIPFDGNPIKLHQFLKSVDRIIPIIQQARNSPMYDVWLQTIRSKIIGDADTVLELYGTDLEWEEIKSNLISHYHDKRDEVSLTRDLFKLTQIGTVQELYENICHIISLLVNQLNLNERDANVKAAKQKYYQEIGLKVFVAGLRPPLGPIIRAQQPRTLKEALRFCTEETNYNYVQSFPKTLAQPAPHYTGAIPKSNAYADVKRTQYRPSNQFTPRTQPPGIQNPRPPFTPNQNYNRSPYPSPYGSQPNRFGYNGAQPKVPPQNFRQSQGTTAFNPAPVPRPFYPNYPKQNHGEPTQSSRTHHTPQYKPNFHVEEESNYWPPCHDVEHDDAYNDAAYYYEEYDPSINNECYERNSYLQTNGERHPRHPLSYTETQHGCSTKPEQTEIQEDELNFHIAEQTLAKR